MLHYFVEEYTHYFLVLATRRLLLSVKLFTDMVLNVI